MIYIDVGRSESITKTLLALTSVGAVYLLLLLHGDDGGGGGEYKLWIKSKLAAQRERETAREEERPAGGSIGGSKLVWLFLLLLGRKNR